MKKKLIIKILFVLMLPLTAHTQVQTIEKLINKQEYDLAYKMIEQTYEGDTMNKDRLHSLYLYYISEKNPNKDSLSAFIYAKKYNSVVNSQDKMIALDSYAKSLLSVVYRTKSVNKLNLYIENTKEYITLNQEAQRIRNQLAYEKAQQINSVSAYQNFVNSYPDAMQVDEAKAILNEKLIQQMLQSNNIDSLKYFASITTSEKYKAQALKEVDRLSFNKALKENSLESYNAYIKEFPQGDYIIMAKSKRDAAQYERYVNEGNISDMMYYLQNISSTDKNYSIVLEKLKLQTIEHYSLSAAKLIDSLTNDKAFIERFAKKYVSDYSSVSIERLLSIFPDLNAETFIVEAENKAKQLQDLNEKKKLSLEDFKKHKSLFTNLNARESSKVFARFDSINSLQPKGKAINFNLHSDIHYLNFLSAKDLELDFFLTENSYNPALEERPNMEILNIDVATTDARYVTDSIIVFSATTTDGYDVYENSENKDIYYSVYKDDKWQKPQVLSSNINSRYNETNPVMSKDLKTLWFSSDRDLNFGNLDIYVSYREDTDDWNAWSEPILLSEDFNTQDNDYILHVADNLLIITQDDDFNAENNTSLEGNTNLSFTIGYVKYSSNLPLKKTKINALSKNNLSVKNSVYTNDKGFFAMLLPKGEYLFSAQSLGNFSPLYEKDENINIYSIEELATKKELLTIKSPFDSKNMLELSKQGQYDLTQLSHAFKQSPYIMTIEVHTLKDYKKMDITELSEAQAEVIKSFLVKKGIKEDMIIVNGVGNEKIVQGWEKTPSIDISFISK